MPVPGTAVMSHDCRYRYHLTRDLHEGEGSLAFVMLNPSHADRYLNDETVEQCIRLAREKGYQTLEVGNLYALRTPKPACLKDAAAPGPIGPCNDRYLQEIATRCSKVVAAWGGGGKVLGKEEFRNRANDVLQLLWRAMECAGRTPRIYRLVRLGDELTQSGHPLHPKPRGKEPPTKLVPWNDQSPPRV